jgi:amidase
MDAIDVAFAGAFEQARLIREGEISSPELVQLCLDRIAALDPSLRAFTTVRAEAALAEAHEAQSGNQRHEGGSLLGVPIAIKDNIDIAGDVTSYGTGAVHRRAERDAEVIRRLRTAGAIVLGKTTLPELALWTQFTASATWGITRNPWDPRYSCGGSSGGSAVAVAAGMVGAAIGSDGGGSIRVPAAVCGVVGLKPQRDRVPLSPQREHWHGLSVLGPMARTVADAALIFDAIADPPTPSNPEERSLVEAATRDPRRLRVAFSFKPAYRTPVSSLARQAVTETTRLLDALGHETTEQDPAYERLRPLIGPRVLRGLYDDLQLLDDLHNLENRTRRLARLGRLVSDAQVARVRAREGARAAHIIRLFTTHDVLITPVVARPPELAETGPSRGLIRNLSASTPWIAYTQPWNFTGQPAVSVPICIADSELPVGVQLVGRPGDEATIIGLAGQLERAQMWSNRRPPVATVA